MTYKQTYKPIKVDGADYFIDTRTGEIINGINVTIPIGSKVNTPAQIEAYKEYNNKTKKEYRNKTLKELGYFYFLAIDNQLNRLSPETAARLVYLCTYLNFDNCFMLSPKSRMQKSDLQRILNVSTGTLFKFWQEVSKLYIIQDNDGLKLANDDIIRGKINSEKNAYQKFYIEAIRILYRATTVSKHKYLGNIYQILPLINREYNILCWNQQETILDDVERIDIKELCELLKYDVHNYKKLLNNYRQITFNINGKEEYFLSYVKNDDDLKETGLFVNPHILYCGSDYKKVEVLGAFCKKKSK